MGMESTFVLGADDAMAIGTTIVLITQLLKFAKAIPDSWGPVAVLLLALVGEVAFVVSFAPSFDRTMIWPAIVAWGNIAASAAGVFGFIRALNPADVTSAQKPPSGVAQQKTGTIGADV